MKSSMKDRVKGRMHEAKGKAKEVIGRVKKDPDMETEGRVQKAAGKVRRKIGEAKRVFEE